MRVILPLAVLVALLISTQAVAGGKEEASFLRIKSVPPGLKLNAGQSDRRNVDELLKQLELVHVDFEVVEGKRPGRIEFRQRINGVPVNAQSYVIFDEDGSIAKMDVGYVRRNIQPVMVDKSYAIEIAERAIAEELDRSTIEIVGELTSELAYEIEDDGAVPYYIVKMATAGSLAPGVTPEDIEVLERTGEWTKDVFPFSEPKRSHKVIINAYDGASRYLPAVSVVPFEARVCEEYGADLFGGGFGNNRLPICEDHDHDTGIGYIIEDFYEVIPVYDAGTCVGTTANCNNDTFEDPKDFAEDYDAWLESNTAECCSGIGDVDIMTNSTWSSPIYSNSQTIDGPVYIPDDNNGVHTVFVPEKSLNDTTLFKANVDGAQVQDVVIHEISHHVMRELNTDLFDNVSTNNDDFAAALIEGLADTLAAIYADDTGASESAAWQVAEDYLISGRNLSVNKNLSSYNASSTPHTNGKIFGNLFYRMLQEGAALDELADMALYTANLIDRTANSPTNKYDIDDLYEVMDAYVNESTTSASLQSMFEEAWTDMGGTIPGGVSAPPAPAWLTVTKKPCSGGYGYLASFPEHSTATYWEIYENTGGGFQHADTDYESPADVGSSTNSTIAVKACNSAGCSSYSPYASFTFDCTI